ncbi:retron St85 family RNA-directed DNA polymerase [Rheinheimera aquimaris]|uniref:retron St85 family RNA-directed DNA polymerase n=1 Tax=Rheinheimera aquimaris TaxID=412437 RepID=UPI003A97AF34
MDISLALSEKLLLPDAEIMSYLSTAPFRYKKYRIPKRTSSETRLIAQPAKPLKFIQKIAIDFLSDVLQTSSYSMAYKLDVSIKDNALEHAKNRYLLKMDFKNFFLSITPELLFRCLKEDGFPLTEKNKKALSGLFFWKLRRNSPLRLSIGAPSSPTISNYVMRIFDEKIGKISKDYGVTYTRYADDITFSTNIRNVLFGFPDIVKSVLKETTGGSIKINSSKTIFTSKAHNRHVTGVTITNEGKISVGRSRKRYIRSQVHKFSLGLLNSVDTIKLIGYIAFVEHIEGGFIKSLEKKYGVITVQNLYLSQSSAQP